MPIRFLFTFFQTFYNFKFICFVFAYKNFKTASVSVLKKILEIAYDGLKQMLFLWQNLIPKGVNRFSR